MGTVASSALRKDPADGPAYGSLEGLGGPRKFKKKPVLVLDPEELAQAHALFQDASADMLGEEVERTPRPATVLGLAPMLDDEPEEMGENDEPDTDEDTPSADAVLSITRRKSSPLPPLDEADLAQDEELEGYASPDGPIEDDIDLETRIFPSLPLRPELAEEDVPVEAADEIDEAPVETLADQESFLPVEAFDADNELPLPIDPDARLSDYAPLPGSDGDDAAEDDVSPPADLAPTQEPVDETPVEVTAPEEADMAEAEPIEPEAFGPAPARFDELPPNKDYDTPDEVYDLETWLGMSENAAAAEEEIEEPFEEPVSEAVDYEPVEPSESADDEAPAPEPESEKTYTLTEDDRVDGTAFMRDPRSRRSAIVSTTPGQQSALRAKLLREAEEAARKDKAEAQPSKSIFAGMWKAMRRMFGAR